MDPTRVLIRQVLGALSQWEKAMIVTKLRSARERARARGGKCEGRKKYGVQPGEQDIIDLIHGFRTTLDKFDQPTGFAEIAIQLNESGFKTRSGRPWCAESVRWIYNNSTPSKQIEMQ